MAKSIDRILNMVDIIGSEEKVDKYMKIIKKSLPKSAGNPLSYWVVYQNIANKFLNDLNVSDKGSVLNCMFNAVKLGLNPDPIFGYIYFIPYKGVLTYQIGYKGMIKLSLQSGKVVDVKAYQVFEKDIKNGNFNFEITNNGQIFKFKPSYPYGKDKGKEILVMSVFYKEGYAIANPMESQRIDTIKKICLSRTPKSPWGVPLYESEMRKKTAIRNHWKTEPKSLEIAQSIEYEESIERGEIPEVNHQELSSIFGNEPIEIPDEFEPQEGDINLDKEEDLNANPI